MDKRRVDHFIPIAALVLEETGIVRDGQIPRSLQRQVSAFGAAVQTGTLLSAVAWFTVQGEQKARRDSLMDAIYQVLVHDRQARPDSSLFEVVREAGPQREREMRDTVLSAAVALRLAMNLYQLV